MDEATVKQLKAELSAARAAGDITLGQYLDELKALRENGGEVAAAQPQDAGGAGSSSSAVAEPAPHRGGEDRASTSEESEGERQRLLRGAAHVVAYPRVEVPSMGTGRAHCLCHLAQLRLMRACLFIARANVW